MSNQIRRCALFAIVHSNTLLKSRDFFNGTFPPFSNISFFTVCHFAELEFLLFFYSPEINTFSLAEFTVIKRL